MKQKKFSDFSRFSLTINNSVLFLRHNFVTFVPQYFSESQIEILPTGSQAGYIIADSECMKLAGVSAKFDRELRDLFFPELRETGGWRTMINK